MKPFYRTILFFTFSLCVSNNLTAEPIDTIFSQQRADYIEAFRAENPEPIVKHYDAGVRLMPEGNPTVFSSNHAQLYFKAFFERFDIQRYDRTLAEVVDMGTQIAEFGFFTLDIASPSGVKKGIEGKYMNLWKKQRDGTIKVVADIWNFDKPIEGLTFSGELTFQNVPSTRTAMQARVAVDSPLLVELAAYSLFVSNAVMTRNKNQIWRINSDDVILYPNYSKVLRGINEVKAFWGVQMDKIGPFSFVENRFDKVDVLGDYIVQYDNHIVSWQDRANLNVNGINTGKHIRIWKRDGSGHLRNYRRISAYDN